MKRIIGIVLFVGGLVASIIFGYQAYEDTASVDLGFADVTLSSADWTPLIISLVVMVVGIILIVAAKPKSRTRGR